MILRSPADAAKRAKMPGIGEARADTIHLGGTPPPLVFDPPSFTYQPPAGFTGEVQFRYVLNFGQFNSAEATVTITVEAGAARLVVPCASPEALVPELVVGVSAALFLLLRPHSFFPLHAAAPRTWPGSRASPARRWCARWSSRRR